MTTPDERAERILTELLGRPPTALEDELAAGRKASDNQKRAHRLYHTDAVRTGAVVWRLRQRGLVWREIYDATGIIQRNGSRWMKLFLTEEITPSDAQLDAQWQGSPDGDDAE